MMLYVFPLFSLLTLAQCFSFRSRSAPDAQKHKGQWITTWTAMPQLTEFTNLPPPPFNQTDLVFSNTTIRQTLRLTHASTSYLRLRFTNTFSDVDLPLSTAVIALPTTKFHSPSTYSSGRQNLTGSSAIDTSTLHPLTFSGNSSITIPNGAIAVSDPVPFKEIEAGGILSVSMYLKDGQKSQLITSHPGSRTSSWAAIGNHLQTANLTSDATEIFHWYFLSGVEVWVPETPPQPPKTRRNYLSSRSPAPKPLSNAKGSFLILGDSITDGRASYNNANARWPDLLFNRLIASSPSHSPSLAFGNQAAGGNRVLTDGLGPNALGRLDRDVLSQSGVTYAMVFEGVNDIGDGDATVANQTDIGDRLIQAYKQMVVRCHAKGIPMFGATITPFGSMNSSLQPYSDPERERTRQRVNEWIRSSGVFDAVVDFDKVVRDPFNETMLRPIYDSGDQLHPSPEGYIAMANAFPLEVFEKFAGGVDTFQ